mgnify:CR=1 FL=1
MRFARIHKAATFLMVLSSLGALLLSGQLPLILAAALSVAFLGAWPVPLSWMKSKRWQLAWTVATVGAALLCLLQIALGGDFVQAAIYFLLFLVINKLYNRQKGRDHLQLYATSLMSVVAGAAVNMGPSYLLCFVLHTIFGVWSLILFQLRREMEENYLLRHSDNTSSERVEVDRVLRSKRIVGWSFLGVTGLGALSVLVFSASVFLFFPRIGLSRWGVGRRGGAPMVGFSQTVELGRHGRLRDNPQVVMRVTFKNKPSSTALRTALWRGMTFDRYVEGRWSRSASLPWPEVHRVAEKTVLQEKPASRALARRRDADIRRAVEYSVLLMPVIGGVLPTLHRPVAIAVQGDLPRVKAQVKVTAGTVLDNPRPGKMVAYKGWSVLGRGRSASVLKRSVVPLTREEQRAYLSLPGGLPGTFFALAKRLEAAGEDRVSRVAAAMAHLSPKKGFHYSTRLESVPRGYDPVAYFLFKAKQGHCEYFASALALLLRAMDIPARLVTGFVGGRWNAYGNFLSVRQGDAHAWVEAYLPAKGGWRVLDPTPPEGRVPAVETGFWARLKLWIDSLKLGYLRWVVDYDAHSQWSLAAGARKWVRRRLPGGLPWRGIGYTLLGVLGLVGVAYLVRYLKKRGVKLWIRKDRSPGHLATGPYERLLGALARLGFRRHPGQTPREFAAALDAPYLPQELIAEITELYYHARYAHGDPHPLRELVDQAVETLNSIPRNPPLQRS